MRKLILIIGKLLIVFSLIWPFILLGDYVDVGSIILFCSKYIDYTFSTAWDHDIPLLLSPAAMILGFILCIVSRYKRPEYDLETNALSLTDKERFKFSLTAYMIKVMLICLAIMAIYTLIVFGIIGTLYAFANPDIMEVILAGIAIIALLLFGLIYYSNSQ
jgi:hypothetical protein